MRRVSSPAVTERRVAADPRYKGGRAAAVGLWSAACPAVSRSALPRRGAGGSSRCRSLFPQAALLSLTRNRGVATYAQTLQNIPETQVTTLDNGLRVASEESNHPTCTVGLR